MEGKQEKTKKEMQKELKDKINKLVEEATLDKNKINDIELMTAINIFNLGDTVNYAYNHAMRSLLAISHPLVATLVETVLPYHLALEISFEDKDDHGMSALDYAQKYNPAVYNLLQEYWAKEYKGLANKATLKMAGYLFGNEIPRVMPDLKPEQKPYLTSTQEQIITENIETVCDTLLTGLPDLGNIFTLPPEEADRQVKALSQKIINQINPQSSYSTTLKNLNAQATQASIKTNAIPSSFGQENAKHQVDSKLIMQALEKIIANDSNFIPFLNHVQSKDYQKAIRFAILTSSNPTEEHKALELITCLVNTFPLNLDLNIMKNLKGQTPLHEAALNSKWILYYGLVGIGANSFIEDNLGFMAQDYRRQRQFSFLQTGENPLNTIFNNVPPADPSNLENCIIS